MPITVKLHSIAGGQRTLIGERMLQMRRVTIGRGAECAISLEDPKKYISRVHLQLDDEGGECWMTVVSKVNPAFVNSQRQMPGGRVQVRPGDRIELGEYEIELLGAPQESVKPVAPPPPPPAPPPPPRPAPRAAPRADDPLIQMLKSASIAQEQVSKDVDYAQAIASAQQAAPEIAPELEAFSPEKLPPPEDIFGDEFAQAGALPEPTSLDQLPPPEDIFGDTPAPAPVAAEAKPPAKSQDVFGDATFVGKAAPPEDLYNEPTMIGRSSSAEARQAPAKDEDEVFQEATFVGKSLPPPGIFDEPAFVAGATPAARKPSEPELKPAPEPVAERIQPQAPEPIFDEPTFPGEAAPPEVTKPPEAEPKPVPEPVVETALPQAPPAIFDEPTFVPDSGLAVTEPSEPEPAAATEPVAETTRPQAPAAIFDEPTFVPGVAPATAKPAEVTRPEAAVAPTVAKIAEPAPAGAMPGREPGIERALQIFLEGAGIVPREIADADRQAYLRECGAITRAAVEGIMALLLARAAARKEFQAEDRTMVASRDNNPLKLMSDPQEAIVFLFDAGERTGGFLNPVQAIGDACEDLRSHEIALIAGMRAAILGTIRRFDPQSLEKELEKAGGGFSIGGKKSKLWDQFVATQEKLSRDAEDDFNKVFGREFMGAYMAQVRKLRPPGKS